MLHAKKQEGLVCEVTCAAITLKCGGRVMIVCGLAGTLASYSGSNYAGEEKRAWYILLAHMLSFARMRASK